MFSVEQEKERTKKVTRAYRGGQELTIVYRMDRFTVEEQNRYADAIQGITRKDDNGNLVSENPNRDASLKLAEYLQEMLVSADWEDAQGPIPITAEDMVKRLPAGVLGFAVEMISENKSGKK